MCDKLLDELNKCFLNEEEVTIKQLVIQQPYTLLDDLDEYHPTIKTDVYKLNGKLFMCDQEHKIKEYFHNNKLNYNEEYHDSQKVIIMKII